MCAIRQIPFVLFLEVGEGRQARILRRLWSRAVMMVVKRAAHLVPASTSCARFFDAIGADHKKVDIIPCMPDITELMRKANVARQKCSSERSRLHVDNRFIVVYIGRLVEGKGLDDLFKAIDLAVCANPQVFLLVCGAGPLELQVKKECSLRDGYTRFYGPIDNSTQLCEVLTMCDLHLMPSHYEGYGVVCAEALSCGIPSVVTTTSGCRDLILDGYNGFVVIPGDWRKLAEIISRLSSDPGFMSFLRENAQDAIRDFAPESLYISLKEVITASLSTSGSI